MFDDILNREPELTPEQKRSQEISRMNEMRKQFISSLMSFVENAVVSKRKVVEIPIYAGSEVSKLRHIIKRIATGFGYQIKNMKKRHIIIENTKFVIKVIPKPKDVKL